MTRSESLVALCMVLVVSASAANSQTPAHKEKTFLSIDRSFSYYSAEHGPWRAFTKFMSRDAYILPVGGEPDSGGAAIMKYYGSLPEDAALTWEPKDARCSNDGTVGFTTGEYTFEYKDTMSHVAAKQGIYLTVWEKRPDGSLEAIADMGSPEPIRGMIKKGERLIRIPMRTVTRPDFIISIGTFRIVKMHRGKELVERKGNYIAAWRTDLSARKRTLVDAGN